jgi:predicted RNA binding protein with dsRBD fold (UPF0201 family)
MKNKGRNLLVLFKNKFSSKQEADCLQMILLFTESPEQFCTVHELVDRNRITSKKRKILKESGHNPLRAFRFLINKN